MQAPGSQAPSQLSLGAFKNIRARTVKLGSTALVKTGYLESGERLPVVLQPAGDYVDLIAWTRANLDFVQTQLLQHGGILFRGFNVQHLADFETFAATLSPELLDYYERSTPRTQ